MTNGNPFYVQPGGDMLPGLSALSGSVRRYGAKKKEDELRERYEEAKSAVTEAYQSGDPNVMAETSIKYPEFAQALQVIDNNRNKRTLQNEWETSASILSDPTNAEQYTNDRLAFLEKEGVSSENMQGSLSFRDRYRNDPTGALQDLKMRTAAKFPEKFKAWGIAVTGKTGKESPKQKTGAFLVKDQATGGTSVAIGVFDPNTGTLKTETSEFEGVDIVSALGETPRERQQREVKTAGLKRLSVEEQKRASELISRGVTAAESTATIRRGIELLEEVETGGIDAVANKVRRVFGVESADEGELSNMLGKAVLSQLRETFGAAFTEQEGKRLERIEANFGKSPAANKRLLQQALRIAEKTAKRARTKAKEIGDNFAVQDIDDLLDFSLSNPEDHTVINMPNMSDEELRNIGDTNQVKAILLGE